jgi:hypothetical protein
MAANPTSPEAIEMIPIAMTNPNPPKIAAGGILYQG